MITVYRRRRLLLRGVGIALAAVMGATAISSCGQRDLLWVADRELQIDIRRLSVELERIAAGPEKADRRYALITEIARTLQRGGQAERERTFLSLYVQLHPNDPYNAAYLVIVADSYQEAAQDPLAVHYYRRVLRTEPDLAVRGRSLHLYCLTRLLDIDDAGRRIEYYRELVERFADRVDLALYLYRMGGAYAERSQWSAALEAYEAFLSAPLTDIPDEPLAYRRITELIDFHHSDKSWVRDDLQTLFDEVHTAIGRHDMRAMRRLQAKANFFATSWGSEATLSRRFRLEAFSMRRVRADAKLHPDSNQREAFLRTTGWTSRITTWYLYFRRVDYGVDPRVDGSWEWAGIYFGEKL